MLVTTYAVPPRGRRPYTGAHFLFALIIPQYINRICARADRSQKLMLFKEYPFGLDMPRADRCGREGNSRQCL